MSMHAMPTKLEPVQARVGEGGIEEIPADDGPGLWKQPIHAQLAR